MVDGITPTQRAEDANFPATLAHCVKDVLDGAPGADLRDVLGQAIASVSLQLNTMRDSRPLAGVSIVRCRDQQVDALVLAQGPVVAVRADGSSVEALCDDRLIQLLMHHPSHHALMHLLAQGRGFYTRQHRDALSVLEACVWEHANASTSAGVWVAADDPAAAKNAFALSWPATDLSMVLLMNRGVAAAVEDYRMWTWASLAAECTAHGASSVLAAIRQAERDDSQGIRWPRWSRHQSLRLCAITPERSIA